VTKRELANQFRKAANILESNGWCTHTVYSSDGRFCAIGALGKATYPRMSREKALWEWRSNHPKLEKAVNFALKTLLSKGKEVFFLWRWNDNDAGSGKAVIKLYRECARLLDHGAKL
jgi:hypothetical protein